MILWKLYKERNYTDGWLVYFLRHNYFLFLHWDTAKHFLRGKMAHSQCITLWEARPALAGRISATLHWGWQQDCSSVFSTDSRHLLCPYFAAPSSVLQFTVL